MRAETTAAQAKRDCIDQAADADPAYAKVIAAFCAEVVNAGSPGAALSLHVADLPPLELRHGPRCRPDAEPAGDQAVFRIASVTKPLTALLVLTLVQERRMDLDAPIGRYLPQLRRSGWKGVTIEALLMHTSGLPKDWPLAPESSREAWFESLEAIEPRKDARFEYSNLGYALLGEAATQASKHEDWAHVLEQRVLEPLELQQTHVRADDAQDRTGVDGGWLDHAACGHLAPSSDGIPLGKDRGLVAGAFPWMRSASAAVSTTSDLLRLAARTVDPAGVEPVTLHDALRQSLTREVPRNDRRRHTLGWDLLEAPTDAARVFGHNGDLPHYAAALYFAEDGSFALAYTVNARTQLRATTAAALGEFTQARL